MVDGILNIYLPVRGLCKLVASYCFPRCCIQYENGDFVYCENMNELSIQKHKTKKDVVGVCAPDQQLCYFLEEGIETQNEKIHKDWSGHQKCSLETPFRCYATMFSDQVFIESNFAFLECKNTSFTFVHRNGQFHFASDGYNIFRAYNCGRFSGPNTLVIEELSAKKQWSNVTILDKSDTVLGFCISEHYIVLIFAKIMLVSNREKQNWNKLAFAETQCSCFAIAHPIIYDNLLAFIPRKGGVASGEIDNVRYDLATLRHLGNVHNKCGFKRDGPQLKNIILY